MKKRITLLLFLGICMYSNTLTAQKDEEAALQEIIKTDNQVSTNISKGVYYRHVFNLNADKKIWGGAKGYGEEITCYFEINDSGEIRLVKIVVSLVKGKEMAYQNFIFDETEKNIASYTDYYQDEKNIGRQAAYFGDKSIVGVGVNDKIFIGDDLTDAMVGTARKFYLKSRKYKKMFETIISLQLSE